jgi:WD40 repeat protein
LINDSYFRASWLREGNSSGKDKMKDSAIQHLAVSSRSTSLAAAFFERTVQIWDLQTQGKMAEFETTLSFGGNRLALDASGALCATAAWAGGKSGGVACYETKLGHLLWHRPDLKQTQRLRFSVGGRGLWCVPETGSTKRLDCASGNTLNAVAGVVDIFDSPYAAELLLERRKRDYELGQDRRIRIPRLTFAILDVAFSPDSLTVSEAGGLVRCFEVSNGLERWRYAPRTNSHFLRLWYREADGNYYGIQWEYNTGSFRALVRLSSKTGQADELCQLESWQEEYCVSLDALVTSKGKLIGLSDGRKLAELSFPLTDYPDKAPSQEPRTS